jgi:hypothetical protein
MLQTQPKRCDPGSRAMAQGAVRDIRLAAEKQKRLQLASRGKISDSDASRPLSYKRHVCSCIGQLGPMTAFPPKTRASSLSPPQGVIPGIHITRRPFRHKERPFEFQS